MSTVTVTTDTQAKKEKPLSAPVRLGVAEIARQLGYTRQHVHEVLKGRRHNPAILLKFQQLRAAQQQETSQP
jgi:predicted transcriptional regulator